MHTAQLGTRVLWLGWNLTAANTQWIITRSHQLGLVTYGEFVSTPYAVGIEAGVDVLLHMSRYELGVVPDELQRPLVDDSYGAAANTAYDYSEHLPPTDPHFRNYGHLICHASRGADADFQPVLSRICPIIGICGKSRAAVLNPMNMFMPSNRKRARSTIRFRPGRATFRTRRCAGWRRGTQEGGPVGDAAVADQPDDIQRYPHYLAASGAAVMGTMPGISLHTEMEMLVRLAFRRAKPLPRRPTTIRFNLDGMSLD